MRTISIFIICIVTIFMMTKAGKRSGETKIVALHNVDTTYFKTHIQPIFQKNCTPCHFPGGKMYERLPFDKAETIIHHETSILKRIKKEEETELIKQFILQNS